MMNIVAIVTTITNLRDVLRKSLCSCHLGNIDFPLDSESRLNGRRIFPVLLSSHSIYPVRNAPAESVKSTTFFGATFGAGGYKRKMNTVADQ
jgi:hypothetical protein